MILRPDLSMCQRMMLDELIAQQENENTKKRTIYDRKIVLKFLREIWKGRELEKILLEKLNVYSSEFILAARTKKGEQCLVRRLS